MPLLYHEQSPDGPTSLRSPGWKETKKHRSHLAQSIAHSHTLVTGIGRSFSGHEPLTPRVQSPILGCVGEQ